MGEAAISSKETHGFVKKPYADWAWDHYGSELAADIGYCDVCNRPYEEHESAFAKIKTEEK